MNRDTLLYRQINPGWEIDGTNTISSQAFKPTKKDEGLLSVYDGDQISARDSWLHFTNVLKFESIGALAVLLAECEDEQLPVRPDPQKFLEHTVIDFNGLSRRMQERKADKLKTAANERGWQFRS